MARRREQKSLLRLKVIRKTGDERLTAVIGPHAFIVADLKPVEDARDVIMMLPTSFDNRQKRERERTVSDGAK